MRLVPTFAVCLILALAASVSHAQTQPQVTLDYGAPAECPTKLEFHRALTERLPEGYTVRLGPTAAASAGTLGLRVRVNKSGSNYRAELTTVSQEGRSTPRSLQAPNCGELMDAMAFTAALTVDPNASMTVRKDPPRDENTSPPIPPSPPTEKSTTGEPAPHNSTPATPSTNPTETSTAASPVSKSSSSKVTSANDEPPSASPDVATTESPSTSFEQPLPAERTPSDHHWNTSVLAGVSLTSPIAPGVSPAGYVGVRHADDSDGWSPAITLGGFVSPGGLAGAREASFSSLAAQLEVCPSAFRLASFALRPCAAAQLTFLRAAGERLANTSDVSLTIPSASLFAEFQRNLGSRWYLTAAAGTQLQLQQHRFEVGRPTREIASTRWFAPFLSLRVGLSFDDLR
jgi:hypothetical protein